MTTHKTFYLAGPMRGKEEFNFPAFDAARDAGLERGFGIISPADMDRDANFKEKEATQESVSGPEMCREFAYRDSEALLSLRAENGDGIAMLPGWEKSTGAVAEFFFARWLQLAIVDAETFTPLTAYSVNWLDIAMSLEVYLKGKHESTTSEQLETNQQGAMSSVCQSLQGPEPR